MKCKNVSQTFPDLPNIYIKTVTTENKVEKQF